MTSEIRKTVDPFSSRDRKGGLSCAECRRSKLKCDRVFPCQSCIRRGCAHLCPEGTLAATKGNKVLMAHAQRLSEQVRSMSVRIQELESALAQQSAQARNNDLRVPAESESSNDAVWDPSLQELSETIGSLSIGMDGQAKYHGTSASSEYFQDLLSLDEDDSQPLPDPKYLGLSFELVELMNSFPFGLKDCPYTKHLFVPFLPTKERTLELVDLYYRNAAWLYDPIVASDFTENIMEPIYGSSGYANIDSLHPHRISVFFIMLALGALYDNHPSSSILGEQYHALARAALSFGSILIEVTCAAVQALFMILLYLYASDRASNETRWLLAGVCCRMAQTIGLQRDSARWNLPAEEVQRRRIMFWELYTYDAWTSVVNGRPPALNIQHTDCRFPDDLEPSVNPSGGTDWGWHAWKFRCSASCLSISVQHVFNTKVPPYSAVFELDKRIRKFPLPAHLQSPVPSSENSRPWSRDPSHAMQQYCVVCERESNLLYIHRSYFAQAIRECSVNPLKHEYAPSVLATFRSASRIISSLKGLYAVHPTLSSRVWFFWSGTFSSCIVLGALVVESPGCSLASSALRELEHALPFYEEGSRPCRSPGSVTMLQNLWKRAYSAFAAFHTGTVDLSTRKLSADPDAPDELAVLGGRKSVINNKSASNTPSSKTSSPRSQTYRASSEDSGGSQREALMEYYNDLDKPGFDQGRDFQMVEATQPPSFEGVGLVVQAYPSSQNRTTKSEQGNVHHVLAAPTPTLGGQGFNRETSITGGLGSYADQPGLDYIPPPLRASSEAAIPREPAYHVSSLPPQDTNALGLWSGREANQEEIWSNFMRHLGLQNLEPQA